MDRHVATQNDLDALADGESRESYGDYLDHLVINSSPRPRRLADAIEPWQQERERRRVGVMHDLAGIGGDYHGKRWFWTGCAKGNDKSTGVARRLNWLLKYGRRPVTVYICSGKLEQAALITQAMKIELDLNPWLKKGVHVTDYSGAGDSGSSLTVLPMKAMTGQGIFPDLVIADEITHWQHDEGKQFWNFIVESVTKRRGCCLEVITNAGYEGSWQWDWRRLASGDPRWDFFEQPPYTRLASWMDEDAIASMSKGMIPGQVKRLFRNCWIDPGEERGYITLAEAQACEADRPQKADGLPGIQYFAVIDYGGVHDRTAMAVMHAVPGTDRVEVDRMDVWQGTPDRPVQIHSEGLPQNYPTVQHWLDVTLLHFPKCTVVIDKYQMESLGQVYERRGRRVERFEYNAGKKNYQMAQLLKNVVQSRRISWPATAGVLPGVEDATIAKELSRLVLKPTVYGWRFDHESGRFDDRAAVLGMALIYLVPETPPPSMMPTSVPKEVAERHTSSPAPPVRRDWAAARNLFGMGNQNRRR